jgi:hypothetical protein
MQYLQFKLPTQISWVWVAMFSKLTTKNNSLHVTKETCTCVPNTLRETAQKKQFPSATTLPAKTSEAATGGTNA